MLKFTISVSNLYMKPIWATFAGFPKYCIFMGGHEQGGQVGGAKNLWGGTLAYRNQISVKSDSACSTHTFSKNVCFIVYLNSAGFCDSAMANIGC